MDTPTPRLVIQGRDVLSSGVHAMNLEADLTVTGAPDSVFDALVDPRRAAGAIPGARLTNASGDAGEQRGVGAELRLQAGSSQITYRGRVLPEGADRAGGILRCSIDAREARGSGVLHGHVVLRLLPVATGTRISVDAGLEVTGRAESLGEDRFRDAVLRLLRRAAGRLGETTSAAQPAHPAAALPPLAAEPPPAPAPPGQEEPPPLTAAPAPASRPAVPGEVRLVSDRPVPASTVPLGGTRLDDLLAVLRRRGWIPVLALAALVLLLAARSRRGTGS